MDRIIEENDYSKPYYYKILVDKIDGENNYTDYEYDIRFNELVSIHLLQNGTLNRLLIQRCMFRSYELAKLAYKRGGNPEEKLYGISPFDAAVREDDHDKLKMFAKGKSTRSGMIVAVMMDEKDYVNKYCTEPEFDKGTLIKRAIKVNSLDMIKILVKKGVKNPKKYVKYADGASHIQEFLMNY